MRLPSLRLPPHLAISRAFAALGLAKYVCLLSGAGLLTATIAFAATVYHVMQHNRSFTVSVMTVARGDSIAFSNEDEFLHQIYVDSNRMDFDSAEQHPGETITVTFPRSGTFPIRCHIHPKMLLTVNVR